MACHNRREKTLACLAALYGSTPLIDATFDVFLVDDGSNDGTAIAVREKFPHVKITAGNGQLFWNRGMHLAWKTASQVNNYDYYLWLNDDTNIFSNALKSLLLAAESTENRAVIVAPICSKLTGKLTYSGYKSNGDFGDHI